MKRILFDFSIESADWKPNEWLAYKQDSPMHVTASRDPQRHGDQTYVINLEVQDLLGDHIWNGYEAPDVQVGVRWVA